MVASVAAALLALVVGTAEAQAPVPPAAGAETYLSAHIIPDGSLAIVTMNGLTIIVPKLGEQTSFSAPVVSASRSAVGAQAMFPNCCTSYDIPLELFVYSAGKAHRFSGNMLPIFQWAFADGGTRVAYGQEPVHFGCATHYELRDIESERLIEEVDIPQPCGEVPNPKSVRIPAWVADLISNGKAG